MRWQDFFLWLTHKNRRISLHFLDTELIFWIYASFYVIQKSCFASYTLLPIFKNFIFLVPPSKGGWGKKLKFKCCQKFCFWCLILISARGDLKDPHIGDRVNTRMRKNSKWKTQRKIQIYIGRRIATEISFLLLN